MRRSPDRSMKTPLTSAPRRRMVWPARPVTGRITVPATAAVRVQGAVAANVSTEGVGAICRVARPSVFPRLTRVSAEAAVSRVTLRAEAPLQTGRAGASSGSAATPAGRSRRSRFMPCGRLTWIGSPGGAINSFAPWRATAPGLAGGNTWRVTLTSRRSNPAAPARRRASPSRSGAITPLSATPSPAFATRLGVAAPELASHSINAPGSGFCRRVS